MQNENSSRVDPLELVDKYENGFFTAGELLDKLCEFCRQHPAERDELLDHLLEHSIERVRNVAQEIREMILLEESRIKDIDHLRVASPLQPGVALFLYGGYDSAYSESWWLNGRQYYLATFIDFVRCGADKMPAAFVELEEEVDMTEGAGLRHRGRYALLKLRYVANWDETETVQVHIVDSLPADVEAYYASHPFGTEIESHATYRLANKEEMIKNDRLATRT
jgi:hypothetical protein